MWQIGILRLIKKSVFLYFLCFANVLFADSSFSDLSENFVNPPKNTSLSNVEMQHRYVCPYSYADPLEKSYVYVESQWLYWKIIAQIPFADVVTIRRFPPITSDVAEYADDDREMFNRFDLASGYRIKLGIDLPYEGWSFYGQYQRIASSTNDNVTIGVVLDRVTTNDTKLLYPYWVNSMNGTDIYKWRTALSSQKINYRILDGALSKTFYVSNHFAMTPVIGARGAWITNQLDVTYLGFATETSTSPFLDVQDVVRLQNSFYGWGVRGGLKGNWILGYGFEIFGNAALSTLAGNLFYRNSEDYIDHDDATNLSFTGSAHRETKWEKILNVVELSTGVNWGSRFYKDKIYFGLQFSYELNIWVNFIRLNRYSYASFPSSPASVEDPIFATFKNNLSLNGITLGGRLDF